ncbi:MAG TPA: zinc-binding dehydrogenase [Actinomycetota bacterium]
MRAARFHGPGTDLVVEDVPSPEPGPLEVVVKVEACGICLSDVHLLDGSLGALKLPITPGHEASGTIVRTGSQVPGRPEGERVVLAGGRPCGSCPRCLSGRLDECSAPEVMGFHYDGAWAEEVVVPLYALTAVPEGVPMEQAAILADAVATPYAALADTAGLRPAESVGLWGIGGLGTHALLLARLLGAAPIVAVDPIPEVRERALALGADVALDPAAPDLVARVREATGDLGLDVALDLVGSAAVVEQALACLGRGGRVVEVGMTFEPLSVGPGVVFGFRGASLRGHLGYGKRHLEELVRLVATGRLDLSGSISDVIPLEEVAEGVRRLAEKDGSPVRILVRP